MALLKSIEVNNSGIFAQYWNVIQLNINYFKKDAYIQLAGYLSQQARQDGKQPIDFKVYNFDASNFPFTGAEPISEREEFYTWLVNHKEEIRKENTDPETKNEQPTVTMYVDSEFVDAQNV